MITGFSFSLSYHYNSLFEIFSVGQFTLPISCMLEPQSSRLVQPVDRAFVHCLKQEMILNPTTDVAPFIGHLRLHQDENFDPLHPEAYTYETLGGNNSRVALMEIVEENPSLASHPCYSKHLVCPCSSELGMHVFTSHCQTYRLVCIEI